MTKSVYLMIIVLLASSISGCTGEVEEDEDELENEGPNIVTIDVGYSDATLRVSHGEENYEILLRLNHTAAPNHADNFRSHILQGNYDGVDFHRIIDDFMIQGGDFENRDGTGGFAANWYGYCNGDPMADEENCLEEDYTVPDEVDNGLKHYSCTISMANAGSNTGGSQFFLIPGDVSHHHWLDGIHTVFGDVVEGCDYVTTISEVETDNDRPIVPVTISSAESSGIYTEKFETAETEIVGEFNEGDLSDEEVGPKPECDRDLGPNMNLSGVDLSGCQLALIDLSFADLSNAILEDSNLEGANLSGANLSGAFLSGSTLTDAVFHQAVLTNAEMDDVQGCAASLPPEWRCERLPEHRFWADEAYHIDGGSNQEYYDRIMEVSYDKRESEFYQIVIEHHGYTDGIPEGSGFDYSTWDGGMGEMQYVYLGPNCFVSDSDIQYVDLSGMNLSGCVFERVNFEGSDLSNMTVHEGIVFLQSALFETDLSNTRSHSDCGSGASDSMSGLIISQSHVRNSSIEGSDLCFLQLYQLLIEGSDLSSMALYSGYFDRVSMQNVSLIDLEVTNFLSWYGPYTDCSTVILSGDYECHNEVILGPNLFLRSIDLSGHDLSHMNLTGMNAVYVLQCPDKLPDDWDCVLNGNQQGTLVGPGAILNGANFNGANLSGIDLSSFELGNSRGEELEECPLALPDDYYCMNNNIVGPGFYNSGVDFTGLNMSNVNFTGGHAVNLTGCPDSLPEQYVCLPGSSYADTSNPDCGSVILGPDLFFWSVDCSSMENMDLSGVNLTGAWIYLIDFTNAVFEGATLTDATFAGCTCPDGSNSNDNGNTCENNLI